MTTRGEPAAPSRHHPEPQRAGFVELLYDVVFVFALNQLAGRLVVDLSWQGIYLTILLFLAMWWVWYRLAWTTNRYDPGRPAIQLMVIGTMFGSLLMAASLPTAFRDRGPVFAIVYVAIQVLRHLWLVLLGGERQAQLVSVRILFWFSISAVPWIGGIFAHGAARIAWWTVAVAVDYAAGALDFPTPRLGRAGLRQQTVAVEHLVERYRQFLVIAFGETILISGIRFSPYGFQMERTLALTISFATTVLLWQIYSYRAGELLPAAIASSRAPAHVGALASYAHLVMVAGVGLAAVGDELLIDHPFEHATLEWVAIIAGGPGLFLIGRAVLDYVTFKHVSWSRPIGLLLLAALAPLTTELPLVVGAASTTAVLAGVAVSNVISWRLFPRRPAPAAEG